MRKESVQRFLKNLRDVIELRQTELPTYEPTSKDESTQWRDFVRALKISNYLHYPLTMIDTFRADDANRCLRARLEYIFCEGRHTLLQNASGSGKTSLLFEGLRHRWGLYFVGAVDTWAIGSCDIYRLIKFLADERNYGRPQSHASRIEALRIPLLVRLLAFEAYAQIIDISHASTEDYQFWLLLQGCGQHYLEFGDEYALLSNNIYFDKSLDISAEIDKAMTRIRVLTNDPEFHFYCVVDEAQVLARDVHPLESDTFAPFSPHRDLSQSWEQYRWLTLIMSGTIVPFKHYIGSGYRVTSATGFFDPPQAASYIRRFLPPVISSSESGKTLVRRAGAWVHGRHRFAGAFIALVLEKGLDAPHSLFNNYIFTMAGFKPLDAHDLVEQEETAVCAFNIPFPPLDTLNAYSDPAVLRAMYHVVFKYLVTGTCTHVFDTNYIALVENAAGRFCDDDASQIIVDEPLCIVSAANWLCDSTSRGLLNLDLEQNGGDPSISSIREYSALLLAYALSDPRPLKAVVQNPDPARLWTTGTVELVELHRSLDGASCVFYPFRYQHLTSNRATDCASYGDVLAWLSHERTSPFCLLPDGRSLLFALKLSDGSFCWAVAQTMSKVSDDLSQCFHPPDDSEKDASHAIALLSQIPVPCKTLGAPPILRIAISPTTDAMASDGPVMDRSRLETLAAAINLQDVLHRIVAHVVRIAEPHAPAASELVSPGAPLGPPTTSKHKAAIPRRTKERSSKSSQQTRHDLRPRQKAISPPTGPITRSMRAKSAAARRSKSPTRTGKRSYADKTDVGPQKQLKRPRTIT
ncbi:uncharacterized protein SCHCODRAFT_02548432 [Schizophyllum commune H4-8]|nr:uncharacterized protein SCHCODRAFT_02548432 [Schizophyllum commune H4-8]KAI5888998.1 hypothetical protein SCHCODRAFT_02548432 [Schizophyllum commune H4-8]